jgi:hypothetical protein
MAKRTFTINIDEETIKKIKKLAKINHMKTSNLVSGVLTNFVGSFDVLQHHEDEETVSEPVDEKYVEYYQSLRKLLSSDDIPKDSKEFLVG